MKERVVKNWVTTLIGCIIFVAGWVAVFLSKVTGWEVVPIILLAWVFITSKNSILEGLTMNLLKFKPDQVQSFEPYDPNQPMVNDPNQPPA